MNLNWKRSYHSKHEEIKELFIPSTLEISIPVSINSQDIKFNGEFPRRVQQYEKLAEYNGFYINSPLAGIAYKSQNNDSNFLIKVSGRNEIHNYFSNPKEIIKIDLNQDRDWLQFFNEKGLYSFEYNQSLYYLLKNSNNINEIFFLLYDPYIPQFWHHLFLHYLEELYQFKTWFNRFFPKLNIFFLPLLEELNKNKILNSKDNYKYHFKYVQFYNQNQNKKSYVFSPSTLFSILRALFFDEPYTKSVFVLKDYKINKIYIGFYYHGSNLIEIYNRYSYLMNLSTKNKIHLSEHFYFNIYNDYYYYFKDQSSKNICTGCFICNHYCPVQANPMSLFEKKEYFKKELCILCGLCEEVCESNLNIMDKIRNEINF